MRARFPSEQDSTFSCYRPNKDTDINESCVSWAAHEMISKGVYVQTLFLPPSQSLPSTLPVVVIISVIFSIAS